MFFEMMFELERLVTLGAAKPTTLVRGSTRGRFTAGGGSTVQLNYHSVFVVVVCAKEHQQVRF